MLKRKEYIANDIEFLNWNIIPVAILQYFHSISFLVVSFPVTKEICQQNIVNQQSKYCSMFTVSEN